MECIDSDVMITEPCSIRIGWYVKSLRKDPDNVASGKKFILDGMVQAGLLKDDTMKWINHFEDYFILDRENPRIEVTVAW